ncbi:uncharacterized protein LOC125513212 [Triticum urartu]|uniref:uncharacterized protein LOC125513212 n=1 Tax=Triticum urartu TaxID=4572 RepID=UPI0020445538|nr:uncharacterized protein LOC125513212 [Triticum urartu]
MVVILTCLLMWLTKEGIGTESKPLPLGAPRKVLGALGVVDWNMKFLYVLPGWEGSVSDSRVLRDAMRANRHDSFVVRKGKYYLVDAGYTNGEGFLAPFRSTRYHLKEWAASAQQPQIAKGLYNLRHSRARNVVERIFGFFKKKWAILRSQTFFDIKDQIRIISAC